MRYLVLNNPTITAKEVKYNRINVLSDVSERTIQEWLQKELRLPSHHAARKPLTKNMRKKCLILQKVQTLDC